MHAQTRGLVIALDGPDGVGKTTQVTRLATSFKQRGRTVHITRSSGGTPIGEAIRAVSLSDTARPALTDFYLSLAMGAALSEDIAQRKAKGQVIIVDRSPLAWVAYNAYGGQLEDKAAVFEASLKEFAHWQIDTLFVLEANQTQLYKRRRARGTKDYFEKQDKTYHTRVREGYEAGLAFLRKQKNLATKVLSIDANGTIDEIHESIARAVMM